MDYDLDGRLDLLEANGHIEDAINQIQPSQTYRQAAQLFWNCSSGDRPCYVAVAEDHLGDLARPIVGRGATCADIDGDGDLDLLLTQVADRPLLLRNDQRWPPLARLPSAPARTATRSARRSPDAGGTTQQRQVMPSQLPVPVGIAADLRPGIGDGRTPADPWPNGATQDIADPAIDRMLPVEQAP